jgi:hypothetical protein
LITGRVLSFRPRQNLDPGFRLSKSENTYEVRAREPVSADRRQYRRHSLDPLPRPANLPCTLASQSSALLFGEANNAELANIVRKSYDREDLTADERFRLERLLQAYFRHWESTQYQYRVGLFDEEEYSRVREAWRLRLARPGVRELWCGGRTNYSALFVAAIDDLLNRQCDQ